MLSALVIGVALALPAGSYALLESLRGLSARLTLEPQISVFLPLEAKRSDVEALSARLRADSRIGAVRFVSREEALEELKLVQGIAEVVAAIGRNPLPDAFVVSAKVPSAFFTSVSKVPGGRE